MSDSTPKKARGVLHQLLGACTELEKKAAALLIETRDSFTKKLHLFDGNTRREEYIDEKKQVFNKVDVVKRETTVQEKLEYLFKELVESLNASVQKEMTNQIACVDVEIEGISLGRLPVTAILNLENAFSKIRNEVLLNIPTFDTSKDWVEDEHQINVYRLKSPVEKLKTEKQPRVLVRSAASDKHPAQTEVYNVDEPIAKIIEQYETGRMSPSQKHEILSRIDKVHAALRDARHLANCQAVAESPTTKVLFDYILS